MNVPNDKWYYEYAVDVPHRFVEGVANYIIENICGGIVFEDEEDAAESTIKFYVGTENNYEQKIGGLKTYLDDLNEGLSGRKIRARRIRSFDWIEKYRESVVPVPVGENIVICPPWNNTGFAGKTVITLEPKMAFGTGHHESTRGCLAELETIEITGRTILDLGCGTGILGIYAALKGAGRVQGYDYDPLAVENSIENFELNKVADKCSVALGTLDDVSGGPFDITVVNIIKETIVPIVGELKRLTNVGGHIILAGLLDIDAPEVEEALRNDGLIEFTIRRDNCWYTYNVRVV